MIPPYKGKERNITGNELGNLKDYGLFDLENDKGQTNNLSTQYNDSLKILNECFLKLVDGYYKSPIIGSHQ